MRNRLLSRKLWVAIAGAILSGYGDRVGLEKESVRSIVELFMVYIVGQGAVDAASHITNKNKEMTIQERLENLKARSIQLTEERRQIEQALQNVSVNQVSVSANIQMIEEMLVDEKGENPKQ